MPRLFDDAGAFAQPILGADTAADLRHVRCGSGDLIGLLQPSGRCQHQPVGDVVLERAVRLAERHAALRAAGGLLIGLGCNEVGVDFVEVGAAFVRLTLVGRLLVDGHKSEHALLRHGCTRGWTAEPPCRPAWRSAIRFCNKRTKQDIKAFGMHSDRAVWSASEQRTVPSGTYTQVTQLPP